MRRVAIILLILCLPFWACSCVWNARGLGIDVIPEDVIKKMKLSTCSVLFMPVKHEEIKGLELRKTIPFPETRVIGTGFLVRDNIILTNRHVVEVILQYQKKYGHHDNWYIQFAYPDGDNWSETFRQIKSLFVLVDPHGGRFDVGLLTFNRNQNEMKGCKPLEFGALSSISVGIDIALSGFPFGNEILNNSQFGILRSGAVIHEGIISGIAPHDNTAPRDITMFLCDLNSAPGMSGAPVFIPGNGKTIGLFYAGVPGILGHAIPIDKKRVDGWINIFNEFLEGSLPEKIGEIELSIPGDVVDKTPGQREK
ncbi:MAG: serine protease [Candidatus Theseobacter exili]|nr:serine protease [Candidatus Theseobacter exili]